MIGLIYPNQYGMLIVLSILWELIESYTVRHPILYPLLQEYWIIPEKYWNEVLGNKITDIVANATGYLLASKLYHSTYRMHFFCIALLLFIFSIIYSNRVKAEQSKQL
jgi:hypothetical protein